MKQILRVFFILAALPLLLSAGKIVTLAPALTEIVFALGKGEQIVGNTQFCDFPEAAKKIPKMGAKLDLNLEVLIAAQPDIIFFYPSYYEKVKILRERSKLVVVNHATLQGLYDSIEIIAKELQVEQEGRVLSAGIKNTLAEIRRKTANKKKVKTLLIAGRNRDQLRNMYIIGKKDFLNDILEIAGGINAYRGNIEYPNISIESVVSMNPDFIIELSVFYQQLDEEKVLTLWGKYPIIKAVKNKKIKIIKDNVWLRPGPRVGQIAGKLYRLFYEE